MLHVFADVIFKSFCPLAPVMLFFVYFVHVLHDLIMKGVHSADYHEYGASQKSCMCLFLNDDCEMVDCNGWDC